MRYFSLLMRDNHLTPAILCPILSILSSRNHPFIIPFPYINTNTYIIRTHQLRGGYGYSLPPNTRKVIQRLTPQLAGSETSLLCPLWTSVF